MQKYSNNLIDLFYNSTFAGSISGADVIVKNENAENSESVKIYLVVRNNTVQDCAFQAKGSVVLYASLTMICSLAKDRTLEEVMQISEKAVINELKQVNKQEYGEIVFALESFKKAVTTYIKRKNQGTIIEREVLKPRNLHPSKNVTKFGENKNVVSEIESIMNGEEVIENKEEDSNEAINEHHAREKEIKKPSKQSEYEKNAIKLDALIEEVKLDAPKKDPCIKQNNSEDPELMIVPVGGKKKTKKVSPTKIEVRVVEEDKTPAQEKVVKTVTRTTTTIKKTTKSIEEKPEKRENPYLIQPNTDTQEDSNEEVIDEIDSITEQLTNAISQLNFKFDDDDKNI